MSDAATLARFEASRAQRPAADPTTSVWVTASAGAGKTKVLTDRILSLMIHGTPPSRILALTFTKAAAAEMANRVAQMLGQWTSLSEDQLRVELEGLLAWSPDDAELARARSLFARVLDAPGGMKIQTIHAFCESLLGRFPLEADVAPHFQVLDERSAAEMLADARQTVLAQARDGPAAPDLAEAIAVVATHAHEQDVAAIVGGLAAERTRLGRLLGTTGGLDRAVEAIHRLLDVSPDDRPEAVIAAACADEAFDMMGLQRAAGAMAGGSKIDQRHGRIIAAWLEDPARRAATFEDYLRAFFTQEGARRATLVHKQALTAAPGIDRVLDGEAQRLGAVRAQLDAIEVARATAALLRLGAAILGVYEQRKRARALLDYDDLIVRTRDLLAREGAASWVLYKLDGGLDHVLIDEAQDTNPEQWEVIAALTAEFFAGEGAQAAPRTVFAVGDAKQSIYSFQRADPDAFARMRQTFARRARDAAQTWRPIKLDFSFRSSAAILSAVDAVFAQVRTRAGVVFGDEDLQHRPVRLGQGGLVEVWPPVAAPDRPERDAWDGTFERDKALPASTSLAQLLAQRIADWTVNRRDGDALGPGHEAWLESRGRPLRPGDILVLVRRRNAFVEELVRELKRRDVPVSGVDRMVLREQLAVMDLIALGRVLLLPDDDLTLATVLKGPLIGFDEDELFALAHDRAGSLWRALAAKADREPRFARARQALLGLMARADYMPPYELYAQALVDTWEGVSGRARMLARLGPDANDPMEEFLSLALAYEQEHAPSLEGFLHWLEVGAQEVKRDMEHGQDAVRVMTVHGAKGLQAPIVILPDTMQTPQAKQGVFWVEDGPHEGLLLWPLRKALDGAVAQALRSRAATAEDEEHRRLLYVALTRAEDRLYVCGWCTRRSAPEDCWYEAVKSALAPLAEPREIGASLGHGWRFETPQSDTADKGEAAYASLPPAAVDAPDWLRTAPPPEPTPPRPLAPSRPSVPEPAVQSPMGGDDGQRYQRGRLIHRLLQTLPDLSPVRRRTAAARYLAMPVHELPAAAQAEIAAATLQVLETPAFAPFFGAGSRAEVPVAGLVEGAQGPEVVTGQVDRLVVETERILILDYKTNRPAPDSEAAVPLVYLKQMAVYRALLTRVYPGRRIVCALLWTDGPRLMQLSDATLDAHAP